jgi:hypothetical protein
MIKRKGTKSQVLIAMGVKKRENEEESNLKRNKKRKWNHWDSQVASRRNLFRSNLPQASIVINNTMMMSFNICHLSGRSCYCQ